MEGRSLEPQPMTDHKLRWGVLGTANIGRAAVNPAIRASHNGLLVGVASRSEATARAFAEAGDIPRHYGSYAALLADPEIDAVYIPLPNSLHREWAVRAAEHGKHVLCEKPLALTETECREMEAAAAANQVTLMEAFMYRFHPRTERLVELVHRGAIGEPRVIRSTFTFRLTKPDNIRLKPELGGGALMDVGCYCVNLSRTVAGQQPVEVQAWARWAPSGVDDELAATLRFANGLIAQFDCALTMERRECFEIAGTDGSLVVSSAFLPGTGDVVIEHHRGREPTVSHSVAGADEYILMVEHFADCALNGRPVRYPAAEAAANMRVIKAIDRSARSGGTPVTL